MAQSTVFSQLIKLIPRTQFEGFVARHAGDAHARSLDCWTCFGALLFGQMTGHDSIRAIERVFAHKDGEADCSGDSAGNGCRRVGTAVIGLEVPHFHYHLISLEQISDLNFAKKAAPKPEDLAAMQKKILGFLPG